MYMKQSFFCSKFFLAKAVHRKDSFGAVNTKHFFSIKDSNWKSSFKQKFIHSKTTFSGSIRKTLFFLFSIVSHNLKNLSILSSGREQTCEIIRHRKLNKIKWETVILSFFYSRQKKQTQCIQWNCFYLFIGNCSRRKNSFKKKIPIIILEKCIPRNFCRSNN